MHAQTAHKADSAAPERTGTLSERIAQYWACCDYDDLPEPVIAAAKRHLLDTLAAGINASNTTVTRAVMEAVVRSRTGDPDGVSIWGHDSCSPPAYAALVNGTACHSRELDDFGGCGHNGAVVVPALCAVAEAENASGKDVLLALAAGYDVAGRVTEGAGGYLRHKDRGWHSTGTCGSFGAAAAAAKAMRLPVESFADALGISGTYVGGIWAFIADGADTKRLHPGKGAENGVMAARLAKAGVTGPRRIMEAEWGGFLPTYCGDDAKPDEMIKDLGKTFVLTTTSGIKPYPSCRGIHACLDSLFALINEHGFGADDVERMIVHGTERQVRQLSTQRIDTLLDAQFSLPYSLATAVLSGRSTLDEYEPLRTDDPAVRRIMGAIEVRPSREMSYLGEPSLELHLKDGRRFAHLTEAPRGGPANPLSDTELDSKVMTLVTPVLGAARATALIDAVRQIETFDNFRDFAPLLRGQAAA